MTAADLHESLTIPGDGEPQVIAAEQAVLGCVIQSARNTEDIATLLRPGQFRRPAHDLIFEACLRLADAGQPVHPVAVLAELTRSETLSNAGGPAYLHDLMAAAPTPAIAGHLARTVVLVAWQRRNLAAAAASVTSLAASPGFDPATDLDAARKLIDDATAAPDAEGLRPQSEVLQEVLDGLEHQISPGLPTGIRDLDDATGGLRPGQLVIIGARPGIGKSVMGAGIAHHLGARHGLPVLLVSLEMSREELMLRLIAAESSVSLTSLVSHEVDDREWQLIRRAYDRLDSSRLLIDDAGDVSLAHIKARLRGMARTGGPARLLVVDYLGLMAEPKTENRQTAIAALSRGFKLLAREFAVPVVLLAQLNRLPETRKDRRPVPSDLRDSGAQEQDADVVLLLHREDAYEREHPRAGEMDIIVAKQRQGPQCTVTVAFQGHYGRVVDLARPWTPSSSLENS